VGERGTRPKEGYERGGEAKKRRLMPLIKKLCREQSHQERGGQQRNREDAERN